MPLHGRSRASDGDIRQSPEPTTIEQMKDPENERS